MYEGTLKIVPMERGLTDRAFNVALPEAVLRDMAFLEPRSGRMGGFLAGAGMSAGEPPTLALLGEDANGCAVLNAYEIDIQERVRAPACWRALAMARGEIITRLNDPPPTHQFFPALLSVPFVSASAARDARFNT